MVRMGRDACDFNGVAAMSPGADPGGIQEISPGLSAAKPRGKRSLMKSDPGRGRSNARSIDESRIIGDACFLEHGNPFLAERFDPMAHLLMCHAFLAPLPGCGNIF